MKQLLPFVLSFFIFSNGATKATGGVAGFWSADKGLGKGSFAECSQGQNMSLRAGHRAQGNNEPIVEALTALRYIEPQTQTTSNIVESPLLIYPHIFVENCPPLPPKQRMVGNSFYPPLFNASIIPNLLSTPTALMYEKSFLKEYMQQKATARHITRIERTQAGFFLGKTAFIRLSSTSLVDLSKTTHLNKGRREVLG